MNEKIQRIPRFLIPTSLPTMEVQPPLLQKILDLVLNFQNGDAQIHPIHQHKIQRHLAKAAPIEFVLPAFPAKSPNPEKTLGPLPDFGEFTALQRLHSLCLNIQKIYPPGAQIQICSDGRVFSELVQVPDATVSAYGESIQKIILENHFSHLKIFRLENAFNCSGDFSELRQDLLRKHARPLDEIKMEVRSQASQLELFNGMHRFLFEDAYAISKLGSGSSNFSKNKIKEMTKNQTYQLIQHSDAWSTVIEEHFPEAIRLSIHPQLPKSLKLGIRLIESMDPFVKNIFDGFRGQKNPNPTWRTPWHSVPVLCHSPQGSILRLMKRVDAIALNADLAKNKSNGFSYYEARISFPHQSVETSRWGVTQYAYN